MKLLTAFFVTSLALVASLTLPTKPVSAICEDCSRSYSWGGGCVTTFDYCNDSDWLTCSVNGTRYTKTGYDTVGPICHYDLSCPTNYSVRYDVTNGSCPDVASANDCCGIAPPPPTTNYYRCSGTSCIRDNTNGWTTDPNCGGVCNQPPGTKYTCSGSGTCVTDPNGPYTDPNCSGACFVPPPQNRYRCSGFSCIQDPGGWSTDPNCGGACITCDVTSSANPNPVPYQGQVTFSFHSPYGYTNVGVDTGGGTVSCGPTQLSDGYTWSWTCQSKPANQDITYTASFNNDQGCAGSVGYTVIGCPPNQQPGAVYPSNGNNWVTLTPTFIWNETWGNKIPFSSTVVLTKTFDGSTAQCSQGFGSPPPVVQTPLSCFTWTSGPNIGQPVGSLEYDTNYTWQATATNGCGGVTGPVWNFKTIFQSYFQTYGGNVTAKGQLTNIYLDASKFVCTKTP